VSVVVVSANPCPESFGGAVLERVLVGLSTTGRPTKLIDLYSTCYDPALPFPAVDAAALGRATSVVLVHPTWWTSQPAVLLAWLGDAITDGLPGVKTVVSVTTLGGSRAANFLAGESGKRVIDQALRRRCVERPTHRRLACYGIDRSTHAQRTAFLDRVEVQIGALVSWP
jgi:putative NADPH-quinone reductase